MSGYRWHPPAYMERLVVDRDLVPLVPDAPFCMSCGARGGHSPGCPAPGASGTTRRRWLPRKPGRRRG